MPPTFDSSSQNVWTFVLRKFWQRKASENDSTDWLQYSEPGISCRLTEFQGTSANGLAALHLDIDWQVGNGTTLESLDLLKFASEVTPQGEAALRAISKGLMVSFKYKALCHPSENRFQMLGASGQKPATRGGRFQMKFSSEQDLNEFISIVEPVCPILLANQGNCNSSHSDMEMNRSPSPCSSSPMRVYPESGRSSPARANELYPSSPGKGPLVFRPVSPAPAFPSLTSSLCRAGSPPSPQRGYQSFNAPARPQPHGLSRLSTFQDLTAVPSQESCSPSYSSFFPSSQQPLGGQPVGHQSGSTNQQTSLNISQVQQRSSRLTREQAASTCASPFPQTSLRQGTLRTPAYRPVPRPPVPPVVPSHSGSYYELTSPSILSPCLPSSPHRSEMTADATEPCSPPWTRFDGVNEQTMAVNRQERVDEAAQHPTEMIVNGGHAQKRKDAADAVTTVGNQVERAAEAHISGPAQVNGGKGKRRKTNDQGTFGDERPAPRRSARVAEKKARSPQSTQSTQRDSQRGRGKGRGRQTRRRTSTRNRDVPSAAANAPEDTLEERTAQGLGVASASEPLDSTSVTQPSEYQPSEVVAQGSSAQGSSRSKTSVECRAFRYTTESGKPGRLVIECVLSGDGCPTWPHSVPQSGSDPSDEIAALTERMRRLAPSQWERVVEDSR